MSVRKAIILIGVFFLLGLYYRISNIVSYSTSVDDGLVATEIVKSRLISTSQALQSALYDTNKVNYNSKFKTTLRRLDTLGILSNLVPVIDFSRKILAVPLTTSYAPFQFVFTQQLFRFDKNWGYHDYIFWSRLPSLVFDLLSFLLFILLAPKILSKSSSIWFTILFSFVWAHSLEWRIYAHHASSYAIGIFAVGIIMYTLVRDKQDYWAALLLCSSLLMQYAVLPFLAAYFATYFFLEYANSTFWYSIKKTIHRVKHPLLSATVLFILVYIFFLSRWTNHAQNIIAAGPNKEFIFPSAYSKGLWEVLQFFPKNGYLILCALFSDEFLTPKLYLGFLLLSMVFYIGLWELLRSCRKTHQGAISQPIAVFIVLSYVFLLLLVLVGQYPFAPSRNLLIYLPIILLTIFLGLHYLFALVESFCVSVVWYTKVIWTGLVLTLAYTFYSLFFIYPSVKHSLTSPLSNTYVEMLKQDKANLIISQDSQIRFLQNNLKTKSIIWFQGEDELNEVTKRHRRMIFLNTPAPQRILHLGDWHCDSTQIKTAAVEEVFYEHFGRKYSLRTDYYTLTP